MIDPKDLKDGSFLKQALSFEMNGDKRMALAVLSTEREKFAIKDPSPIVIPIPFHLIKEACAMILQYELEVALGKLPPNVRMTPGKWPKGMQGVQAVARMLMDAAQTEAAGQAAVDSVGSPELKPNLDLILGGQ